MKIKHLVEKFQKEKEDIEEYRFIIHYNRRIEVYKDGPVLYEMENYELKTEEIRDLPKYVMDGTITGWHPKKKNHKKIVINAYGRKPRKKKETSC